LKLHCLAAALAVASPLASAVDAADPAAPVPRLEHRSVLGGLPRGVAEQDLPWKQANEDVARFPRGHADLLKWEGGQAPGDAPPAPATSTPPAARPHQH
jgi:hypothetical protein